MKKIHLLIAALLFAQTFMFGQSGGIFCSQAKIKDAERLNKILKVQYPGDSTIDITYYKLNLKLSYSPQFISGVVTVKFKVAQEQLNSFFLDLVDSLKVNSIKLNGNNLSFSQPIGSNKLMITLDRTYIKNEIVSVDISYQGVPGSGGFGSFEFSSHNNQPIIWTLSEPYGAKDWWPSKDTPADKADSSDVWITADSFYVSVSNGTLTSVINNGDGTKTYKWHNSYPIAGYLISLAMTNYALHQNQFEYEPGKSMPVTHYIYPEDVARTSALFDKTVNMLKIFSDKFGLYPFIREKYGHAEFGWSGGMEHQTCTSIGLGGIDEFIIAHELAHQWFGDKVTCKDWHDIWLNEGFATYSEAIYAEAAYGHQAFIDAVTGNFGDMQYAKSAKNSVYVQNISDVNTIFNYNGTYAKGAVVLHMLRGIVGDSTFFNILRQYLVEPGLSYNVATTADFERIAERVSGKDLKYFFDEWIYGVGYPKYTVSWTSQQVTGNDYKVLLQISQATNSSPKFFTMPIQIKITTTLGVSTVTIANNQQTQNFEIPVKGQPTSVEFDPNLWIMKDFTIATDYVSIKPITFVLSQNYPNPFNPSTVINYQTPSTGNVLLKVYDITGRNVATLVDKIQQAGNHSEIFDAHKYGLSSGIYFYELRAGKTAAVKKMMILK